MGEMVSHRETLKQRHANIDSQIAEEQSRPTPDATVLHELKKKKLRIKDEIQRSQKMN